jgi:NAD(P)-dependent dehydrogenase (short-subunit alcohol dehydrogenase family)
LRTTAVTGAASGIGRAVCERLVAQGEGVIGVDLHDAEIVADLSEDKGRASAVREIGERCGGRLDGLVLSAGVAQGNPLPLIASVNYFGAIDVLDGLLPVLREGDQPAAVGLCSNSARMAPYDDHPYVQALLAHDEILARRLIEGEHGFLAYAGSKLALGIAVRRRAMEFGQAGVRLNAVAPGPVETPLLARSLEDPVAEKGLAALPNPLGRRAQPAEIAALIAFLLGPEAGYVHGGIWYVDGGIDAALRPDTF